MTVKCSNCNADRTQDWTCQWMLCPACKVITEYGIPEWLSALDPTTRDYGGICPTTHSPNKVQNKA